MENNIKVYCRGCKWYSIYCYNPKFEKLTDDPVTIYRHYPYKTDSDYPNRNNNCKGYKQSFNLFEFIYNLFMRLK